MHGESAEDGLNLEVAQMINLHFGSDTAPCVCACVCVSTSSLALKICKPADCSKKKKKKKSEAHWINPVWK